MTYPAFTYIHPATNRRLTLRLHAVGETLSSTLSRVRTYEPAVSSVIVELLRPGDAMVDVGANIGWHTVLAAEKIGPTGRVYAFEPDPTNFEILEANCATNGLSWVTPVEAACGDVNDTALLRLSATNFGDHRLYAVPGEDRPTRSVRLVRLDDELGTRLDRPRLVKIDTQGFEPKVLRGMGAIVERWRPSIVLEFWPHGIVGAGESVFDILAFIERWGYVPHLASPTGLELTTPGVLLELSRTLLSPESRQFIDLVLLQPEVRSHLLSARSTVSRGPRVPDVATRSNSRDED